MEWVEASARTYEEAKSAVLELLGVNEEAAEIVIVFEPRAGSFGRMRGEFRVRARVRPSGSDRLRTRSGTSPKDRAEPRGNAGSGRVRFRSAGHARLPEAESAPSAPTFGQPCAPDEWPAASAPPPAPAADDPVQGAVDSALRDSTSPGRVVFNPPAAMQFQRKERVEVRIARSLDMDEHLKEGLKGAGIPRMETILTSAVMKVDVAVSGPR